MNLSKLHEIPLIIYKDDPDCAEKLLDYLSCDQPVGILYVVVIDNRVLVVSNCKSS